MDERLFRFYIPAPGPRWLFIGLIIVCLLTAVWLFLDDFAGGAYIALASALLLVLPATGVFRSYLEISSDGHDVRFVPSSVGRMLGVASVTSTEVSGGSELLLCARFSYGLFDEYAIVVRHQDGGETTLWRGMGSSGFSHGRAEELAEAVSRRFEWPVRLLARELRQTGWTEREWLAPEPMPAGIWVPLAIGSALPLAGIPIRFATANHVHLFWTGIVLWLALLALRTYLFCRIRARTEGRTEWVVGMLTATINFAVLYFLVIVMVSPLAERLGINSR